MAGSWWSVAVPRRTKWSSNLGGTLWLLSLMTLGQAYGHDPGRGPPSDTGPPVQKRTNAPPPLPAQDNWHHNLVRERPIEVRLRTAQKELQAGQVTEALLLVQAILDSDDDVFVRLETEPVPSGAQHLADEFLASLSPEAQRTYETLHGSEARRMLAAPDTARDVGHLARIVRRFFHTAAGRDATVRLAYHWLDHGNAELAAACWQRLLDDSTHRQHLKPEQLAAAACCFHRAGRLVAAREVEERLSQRPLLLAGRELDAQRWLERLAAENSGARRPEAAMVCGTADRNGGGPGTIPALGRPVWCLPLAGKGSEHVTALATAWETFQRQMGLPIGAAHVPLLVDDRLIFRDYEGIRAVSVRTGATLWFYPTAWSVSREIAPRPGIPAEGNPDPNDAMQKLVANSVMGTFSADGRNIFAIDRNDADAVAPPSAGTPPTDVSTLPHRQGNILLALAVAPSSSETATQIRPVWTVGGGTTDGDRAQPRPLAGHYFIGPPLPIADRLYAVSEFQQELYLSCLDATSGAVGWSRSLCSVSQPISADHHRAALVCSPSYGAGVLVVPTQAGVLVAADPITGRLLWAASHDDSEPQHRQQMSAWPYSSRRRFGHRGYTNLPLIHEDRVVYLPAHSEYLHCLELRSGKVQWRVARDDLELSSASEYVAAIADDTVLLVGRRRCRGLDLHSGAERYSVRLGNAPAGRGVRLESDYHVPLENGRVVSIDVSSGRLRGTTQPGRSASLGNLVAAGDLVISMGRTEITAWPQAEPELARLHTTLSAQPTSLESVLSAAELELSLGRADRAQARLDGLKSTLAHAAVTPRLIELEREITLTSLQEPQADRRTLLERLARLASTPEQRGRYLLERALFERQHNVKALSETAREIADHDFAGPLPLLSDPSRSISIGSYIHGLLRVQGSDVALRSPADGVDSAARLRAADAKTLRRYIELNADDPQVDEARLRLARLTFEQKDYQSAELLLLRCRESARPSTSGAATRMLVELWQDRKLAHDAGRMLDELQSRFATVDVGNGLTGDEYVASYPRDRSAWEAYRRFAPPNWSDSGIRISETRDPHDNLQAIYGGNGIISLTVPRSLPFDLFDKGRSGVSGELTLFDRHTGVEYPETITIPGRYHYPVHSLGHLQHSYVGHFLPIGGPGAIHGVSLLERKLLWTITPACLQPARDSVRIGPAGPGFCACQLRQHLMMLNPADGRLLWHRDDLETMSGLMTDAGGIIGDERVIVVFSAPEMNAKSYTVYDTATGEELRRGRLDASSKARRAYGRLLFHATSGEARRLRVWDPLTDQFVWDAPADEFAETSLLEGTAPGTKLVSFIRDSEEAAFITRDGRIRVVDLPRGETLFDVPLTSGQRENLTGLTVFRDRERYYFNLQRSQQSPRGQQPPTHYVSDAVIPTVRVQGDLWAVDRRSHEVLWTVPIGDRSIVQLPDFRLPVLVGLFRVKKADQPSLGVEVIDVRTGDTVAIRDDLLSDRMLQAIYNRQAGVIALRGGKTEIRVEFPDDLATLNAGEPRR